MQDRELELVQPHEVCTGLPLKPDHVSLDGISSLQGVDCATHLDVTGKLAEVHWPFPRPRYYECIPGTSWLAYALLHCPFNGYRGGWSPLWGTGLVNMWLFRPSMEGLIHLGFPVKCPVAGSLCNVPALYLILTHKLSVGSSAIPRQNSVHSRWSLTERVMNSVQNELGIPREERVCINERYSITLILRTWVCWRKSASI